MKRLTGIAVAFGLVGLLAGVSVYGAGDEYTITAKTDEETIQKGKAAGFSVTITPKPPWVLKTSTPFKVAVEPPKTLDVAQTKFSAKDFVDPEAKAKSIATVVTGKSKGTHTLKTNLTFFLCTESICKRMKDSVTTKVTVK